MCDARAHIIMHIVFNNKLNSFSRQPMQPSSQGTHNVSHHCCYLFTPATSRCNRISDCSRFGSDQSASPCLHVFLRPNGLLCECVARELALGIYQKRGKEIFVFSFRFVSFDFVRTKTNCFCCELMIRECFLDVRHAARIGRLSSSMQLLQTSHNPRWSHVIRRPNDYIITYYCVCAIVWQSSTSTQVFLSLSFSHLSLSSSFFLSLTHDVHCVSFVCGRAGLLFVTINYRIDVNAINSQNDGRKIVNSNISYVSIHLR